MRAGWKFCVKESGELWLIICGIVSLLVWCAENWVLGLPKRPLQEPTWAKVRNLSAEWLLTGTVLQRVMLSPHSSRVPDSVLSLDNSLCELPHVVPKSVWGLFEVSVSSYFQNIGMQMD